MTAATCRDSDYSNFREFIKGKDYTMKNSQCEFLFFLSNPRGFRWPSCILSSKNLWKWRYFSKRRHTQTEPCWLHSLQKHPSFYRLLIKQEWLWQKPYRKTQEWYWQGEVRLASSVIQKGRTGHTLHLFSIHLFFIFMLQLCD